MIIPTIALLAQYFGVSAGGAAQIVTVFAIGKFIGTIIGGVVIDRMGTRTALVGGYFQPRRAVPYLRPTLSVFGGAFSGSGKGDIRP